MKVQELKENESVKVVEVSKHVKCPTFYFDKGLISKKIGIKQIEMKVFTDGEVARESEKVSERIDEYYIGNEKYQHNVDTLNTKNVFFRNHSYVITYLIAKEWITVGNTAGWLDVIKDVKIYLANLKDKKALENVKEVISIIENNNYSVNFLPIFSMPFGEKSEDVNLEHEQITEEVYTLKKRM